MSTNLTPLQFLAGTEEMGSASDGWTLDHAPHGAAERTFRRRVSFERRFGDVPLVHLGLTGLDASGEDAMRLTVRAGNISREGFDLVLTTWLHSRLWRVDVSWLALGP